LLDPLGGQSDLAAGSLRVTHARSFLDDPTRMLRAARYGARYGFELEAGTRVLIDAESTGVLRQLSGERLRHELDLAFEEQDAAACLARLAQWDLLRPIDAALSELGRELPEIAEPPADWGEPAVTGVLTRRQSLVWCAWLLPLSGAQIDALAARLAFPGALHAAARAAAQLLAELPSWENARPSQWTARLDESPALAVHAVYLKSRAAPLREYLANWRHVQARTTGQELRRRGLPPGPVYGRILARLRAARLDGEAASAEAEAAMLEDLLLEAKS
jgi:tRNA nucleotidyltransferase (CCA-adding enzyme)